MRDDRGVEVARKMMEAGENNGGFADYVDGTLKMANSTKILTEAGNISAHLVGGYSEDLPSAPVAVMDIPAPAVMVSEVVGNETLVTFGEAAADAYRRTYESNNQWDIMSVRNAVREKGRPCGGSEVPALLLR